MSALCTLRSVLRHTAWPVKLLCSLLLGIGTSCLVAAEQDYQNDVSSIDSLILAVYDVISGDAGQARDWQRWHYLFAPGATLSAVVSNDDGGFNRLQMTPASYAADSGPVLERNGFYETEIYRVTEQFGEIAHAFSTYESRRQADDSEPFARGINSFQLQYDGERWWVVSIYWQAESAQNPIPARYLP